MIRRLLVGNVRGELACLRPEGIHLLLNGAFLTLRVTFGKTKVSYLNSALLVKENVLGLQIAMDVLLAMHRSYSLNNLCEDL